jgi:1,6-anhydro-N-acetylmuramate kinase
MGEVQQLDHLRALAARKRWMIGLRTSGHCRRLDVALVGTEGRGLASRAEVHAYRGASLPREVRRLFARLRRGRGSPAEAALLAAQLAEGQAALVDEFASQIAPVWERVLAVAVDDPGLWHRSAGLVCSVGLCDTARLADLCGLNVVDGFAGRDLAQGGRGRPLSPVPYWILLHDVQKTRVLVEWNGAIQVTFLPASRDASGASRVRWFRVPNSDSSDVHAALADGLVRSIARKLPSVPRIDQLVLCCPPRHAGSILGELATRLPHVQVLEETRLGVPNGALGPAAVALLGLLNLDQVPAGATEITGARTARVLGRLTPGSLASWRGLVCELAAAKPSVVSLRSAV